MNEMELMTLQQFSKFLGWDYQKGRRLALKYGNGTFLVKLLGRSYVSRSMFSSGSRRER